MKIKIKDEAIKLFYKKSYFATSMSVIAKNSKIQKASIYHHYSKKEDILYDILTSTMADLTECLNDFLFGIKSTEYRLRAAVRAHVKFHCERQKEVLIADSELRALSNKRLKEFLMLRDDYEDIFKNIIQAGIDEGIFRKTHSKICSFAVITMCTSVANWFRPNGELSKENIMDLYEELVINGLKSRQLGENK